jgi:membrane-associated protease RseP (regulator of RpoE activity)
MEKNKVTVLVVVVAAIALLVGCAGGALAGGAVTYLMSSRAERMQSEAPWNPAEPQFDVPALPNVPDISGLGGLGLQALVTVVTPDSPAERAGIQQGDLIIRFDGKALVKDGPAAMITTYRPGDSIGITVLRNGEELDLDVTVGENSQKAGAPWLGITYELIPVGPDVQIAPDQNR